jgi:hypothetical protein
VGRSRPLTAPEIKFFGFLPVWREQLGGRVAARFVIGVRYRRARPSFIVYLCGTWVTTEDDDHGAGNRSHIVYSSFAAHSGIVPLCG